MELSRVERILKYFLGEEATLPQPLSRVEELLIALGELIEEGKISNPISIRGRVDTVGDLPSDAESGWMYFVGLETDTEFAEYIYLDSGRWEYLGSSMISIDTTLSTTSTNPVQNSTIANAINTINELIAKKPGEITTGKQYVIGGQTVTAGAGAETFNDLVNNKAAGINSHAEGGSATASGLRSHAEGYGTTASGHQSHAEGFMAIASGNDSHAEGYETTASGDDSHAEGIGTTAAGLFSHAEGCRTTVYHDSTHGFGDYGSHAEGYETTVYGEYGAHAEGRGTRANGDHGSHAEGRNTQANGSSSHAEGMGCIAHADESHVEGLSTKTTGYATAAHVEGSNTIASSANQHVQGKFNVEDANDTYAFIIGNGTSNNARHNAFAIDWNGLIYVNGAATGVDVSAFPSPADINTAITKANAAAPQSTTYTKTEIDATTSTKADLVNGKIPAAQLPSFVDDVMEYDSAAAFPSYGESGKIYVAKDTNKTYRWGNVSYVEISESLALGETASSAYAGNKGKANADAIAAIKDGTTIDSFGDVETELAAISSTIGDINTILEEVL